MQRYQHSYTVSGSLWFELCIESKRKILSNDIFVSAKFVETTSPLARIHERAYDCQKLDPKVTFAIKMRQVVIYLIYYNSVL